MFKVGGSTIFEFHPSVRTKNGKRKKQIWDYVMELEGFREVDEWRKVPKLCESVTHSTEFHSFRKNSSSGGNYNGKLIRKYRKELSEAAGALRYLELLIKKTGPVDVILDVCCGKGFIAVMASYMWPDSEIWALDINEEINVRHLRSLKNVEFKIADLFDEEIPFHEWLATRLNGRTAAMAGVHLCGRLAEVFVDTLNILPNVVGGILVPCCKSKSASRLARELKVNRQRAWETLLFRKYNSNSAKAQLECPIMTCEFRTALICLKNPKALDADEKSNEDPAKLVFPTNSVTDQANGAAPAVAGDTPESKALLRQFCTLALELLEPAPTPHCPDAIAPPLLPPIESSDSEPDIQFEFKR